MSSKIEHRFPSHAAWRKALNEHPNEKWIKTRNIGNGKKSQYMPIPVQQALADVFFLEADVIKEQYMVVANEILCTVTISILPDYPDAEHRTITGTGAKPIQMKSGGNPAKFPQQKIINALEYCGPNARIAAISNAYTTFANVFGRQLGRGVSTGFNLQRDKKKKNDKKD